VQQQFIGEMCKFTTFWSEVSSAHRIPKITKISWLFHRVIQRI